MTISLLVPPIATLIRAAADGRVTAAEAEELLKSLLEVVVVVGPGLHALALIEWVEDMFHRDRDQLLAAAQRHQDKGHLRRAAKLRLKAEAR